MPEGEAGLGLYPRLAIDLSQLCGSERFKALDQLEAYYRCTQYEQRQYDWTGALRAVQGSIDYRPNWYVPMRLRKPCARYDLPRLIVQRLTAMVFGAERFPQFVVDGDDDAQDYVRQLAREALLMRAAMEIRDKGGAQGSACASFGFVDGKPRIYVHNAKHITVLRWADRYEYRPAEALEAYKYPREVFDQQTGKTVTKDYYFARYWDETSERVWDPIPAELAKTGRWVGVHSVEARHDFGFCPVYWVQNHADSESVDGAPDYEGQSDKFDEINILLSATSRGTVANVDPTLVIKDDPNNNTGEAVKKGSGQAIWSKGGAEYLELKGDSLKAALGLFLEFRQQSLDSAGVVVGDPNMTAKAQSAAAMRMLYLPMINQADKLREQYGRFLIQLMRGMLIAAKKIGTRDPGAVVTTADGIRIQVVPSVKLEDRYIDVDVPSDDPTKPGKKDRQRTPRVPGQSETIELNWPPYFPNTWTDTKMAIDAISEANGHQPVISQRTSVETVSSMFGIADVDQELEAIAADTALRNAMAVAAAEAEAEALGDVDSKFQGDRNEPKEE